MNDDLNVIVWLIDLKDQYSLIKVAVMVKHGMNKFRDWEYFGEEEVAERWKSILARNNYESYSIIKIEEINGAINVPNDFRTMVRD